jgi:hypothetical protein
MIAACCCSGVGCGRQCQRTVLGGSLWLNWGSSSDFIGDIACTAITTNLAGNAYDFEQDGTCAFRNDPYTAGASMKEIVYTYSSPVCHPAMQVEPLVNWTQS